MTEPVEKQLIHNTNKSFNSHTLAYFEINDIIYLIAYCNTNKMQYNMGHINGVYETIFKEFM